MRIIYPTLLIICLFACKDTTTQQHDKTSTQQNNTIKYAKKFTIQEHSTYTLLQVHNPWKSADVSFTYLVYDAGTPKPDYAGEATFVERPIKRIACTSTTHVALLDFLQSTDLLVGISGAKYIYNNTVNKQIAAGTIQEIGTTAGLNYEKLLDTEPDIVLTYGMGTDNNIEKIKEAGLTPIVMAEYMDQSPLGRAEWVKFISVFLGKEAYANMQFDSLSLRYENLKQFVKKEARSSPSVLVGMGLSGNWFVPGGESYVAQHIHDAGGAYLWQNQPGSSSLQLDFEAVYDKAQQADKWINIGMVNSGLDIINSDERYAQFQALKAGELYNGNQRVSAGGGYDIYESAVVHPDLVLKDLIKAFHPDLLPEHEWVYYKKLITDGNNDE